MGPELVGNIGYLAFRKEAVKGVVAGAPNVYVPLYNESMQTNANFVAQQPIYGGKHLTYATLQGQRDHQGDFTILAEPNTSAIIADMFATKGTTTGAGPYTHPFDFSATANPKSYTIDISLGNVVKRFWGFEISSFAPDFNDNEIRWAIKGSALGSFQARTIKTIATNTLTLDTTYDPNPTLGLFAGDLVRVYKAATGAVLDTTVTSITNGTTVVLGGSAAAFAAGDILHLRPATPTFSLLPTFLWSKMQFYFGADATAALAASQTRVETGSTFEIMHPFENDGGKKRSGGFDPASLVRLASDATLTIKKFLNTPEDIQAWNDLSKKALVIRFLSGDANQYELRVIFYNLTLDEASASIESNSVTYATESPKVNYDPTAGKAVAVTAINSLTTV